MKQEEAEKKVKSVIEGSTLAFEDDYCSHEGLTTAFAQALLQAEREGYLRGLRESLDVQQKKAQELAKSETKEVNKAFVGVFWNDLHNAIARLIDSSTSDVK